MRTPWNQSFKHQEELDVEKDRKSGITPLQARKKHGAARPWHHDVNKEEQLANLAKIGVGPLTWILGWPRKSSPPGEGYM